MGKYKNWYRKLTIYFFQPVKNKELKAMFDKWTSRILSASEKMRDSINSKLSNPQKKILDNILTYINDNKNVLNTHYLSVKTENGQNKNNDIYEFIDNNAYNYELLKVSIVILTANYYECEILNLNVYKDNDVYKNNKKIKQLQGGLPFLHDEHIVKAYIMEINGYTILHLHAPETGSNTPCGSSDLVRYVEDCIFLNPSCIISFGICYGTDYTNYSLGDTLIAEKIYPWSIGIKINNDGWKIKCDDYIINLKEKSASLYNKIKDITESTKNLCPNQKAKLVNMLTSEAVVSNETVKIEAIQNAYGCNIAGGEMEGYGLAKECIYYNHTSCVIIKAICDWGAIKNIDEYIRTPNIDENYKDQIQAYTTYCAYKTLNELFLNKIFENNDIIESVHKDLFDKYYSDGSIRRKVLDATIEDYLRTHVTKFKKMSLECKDVVKNAVINSVCKSYFKADNKNECYIFNEFFI